MDANKGPEGDEDAYLASFESSNRKQKIIVIAAAIIVALVAAGAFYATIGSMGKMSENVHGAFDETAPKADGQATPDNAAVPKAQDAAPQVAPPADAPSETPAPVDAGTPETQGEPVQPTNEAPPTPAP